MPASKDATAQHHLPRLDSLRGIGALMVGGFHSELGGGPTPVGQSLMSILGFFFDGRTGVSIFFVLSGLVLGMSLRRSGKVTGRNFLHFCGRRFFRLYPAYFISTLSYLMLYVVIRACFLHGIPIGHGWCDYFAQSPAATWKVLVENFCFANQFLNVASWTLKVEAQAALVLPLLHAFSLRFRGKGEAILLVALVLLSFFTNEGVTRVNLYLFYLGYLIPPALESLRAMRSAAIATKGGWFIAIAITSLVISHLFAEKGTSGRVGILFAAIGSTLLLAAIMSVASHPIFYVLDHRVMRFIGTVSYSFYLFNLLSVDLAQRAYFLVAGEESSRSLHGWWIVFPTSSLLCLALSAASFYFVERPGIRLGGNFLPSGNKRPPASAKPMAAHAD